MSVSLRSIRAEKLSDFIGALLDGDSPRAQALLAQLPEYPILLTRHLSTAREWLRRRPRE
ncbi:hypothetical protein [Sphingobium tyrosinilyticum]|uniref:Uncharacterized protein n=1 Tax=Sphingobium tyrosinilyticum TaxID=2715436 RepID=A0ABV9EX62_9SPHN